MMIINTIQLCLSMLIATGCGSSDDNAATQAANTPNGSPDYYPTVKNTSPRQYDGYKLVWNDEFDVDGKLSSAWGFEQGFVRNKELQWYQKDNATVENGCLVIEGRKEKVANPNYVEGSSSWRTNRKTAEYTSASVNTSKSFVFKYGRMEVRAKIPTASGSWPAIWTLGNQWSWPINGEIDQMEFYRINGVPTILANACWSSAQPSKAVWNSSKTPLTHFTDKDANWVSKYHIWRMDWDNNYIMLYLDGELLNKIDLSKTANQGWQGNYKNPFSNDVEGFGAYILLNLAIGEAGGTPDDTKFPLKYYIDYVRVYQVDK